MTMHESEALGVDIGGVIIDRVSENDQSYAGAAAVEGAFEAVDRQQVDKAMGTALRVSPSRPSLAQEESIPSLFSWVFVETWLLCPETLSVTDVNDQMGLRVLTIVGNGS